VLRRILPKREEVAGDWRRLHNEIRDLYASSNIIRMVKSRRIGGICSRNGRDEKCIQNFGRKT
jgi:hypothetical protein